MGTEFNTTMTGCRAKDKIKCLTLCMLACILTSIEAVAATPNGRVDRQTSSLVSPYYFGPNAFPVPEMLDGTVSNKLRIELDAEYIPGFRGDLTKDIAAKINIPLFTDRVNLSLWMTAMEWYHNTDESIEACRLTEAAEQYDIRDGHTPGDAYISTDILLLREGDRCPAWNVRAVLKSASDDAWHLGRYYDSPGYFFDTSVGKNFRLGQATLRLAASSGFLCWQTDNGRQDDATMYGVLARIGFREVSATASFTGYSGWENTLEEGGEMAHDRPTVISGKLIWKHDALEYIASYQYGLRDYPYQRFGLGIAYSIDILERTITGKK